MEVGGSWGLHTSQVRSGVSPRGRGSAERSRGSHLTSLLAATHATDKRIKKVFFSISVLDVLCNSILLYVVRHEHTKR